MTSPRAPAAGRRYAAFLRGVSPMNAKMPDLRAAFESAGFTDVKTVISSGNVVFGAGKASIATLERRAEAAMEARLGRTFLTIVRPIAGLAEMQASDPYRTFRLHPKAKRIVTFLRDPPASPPRLPVALRDARLLALHGRELFGAYVAGPDGPDFMKLIEDTFGKALTTRTWDTVTKVVRAGT